MRSGGFRFGECGRAFSGYQNGDPAHHASLDASFSNIPEQPVLDEIYTLDVARMHGAHLEDGMFLSI